MLLMALLVISGCEHNPIDKQEADNIVTRYVKKNYTSNDNIQRAVWYLNRLEEERIELFFGMDGEENIVTENAFVYYIDENCYIGDNIPHSYRIIIVQKKDGKYTLHERHTSPGVVSSPWENDWMLLFFFENNQIQHP